MGELDAVLAFRIGGHAKTKVILDQDRCAWKWGALCVLDFAGQKETLAPSAAGSCNAEPTRHENATAPRIHCLRKSPDFNA